MPNYRSDRGMYLVFQEVVKYMPVLTVENYCKWYCLYLVDSSGDVTPVDFPEDGYTDHVPHPDAVEALAESRGWVVDEQSMEMIIGRYMLEARMFDIRDLSKLRLEK